MQPATLTRPPQLDDRPTCEVRWECPDGHPNACDQPATERMTIVCATPECDCAVEVVLGCASCAEAVHEQLGERVVSRRL